MNEKSKYLCRSLINYLQITGADATTTPAVTNSTVDRIPDASTTTVVLASTIILALYVKCIISQKKIKNASEICIFCTYSHVFIQILECIIFIVHMINRINNQTTYVIFGANYSKGV